MECYTACFFGHRKFDKTKDLEDRLYEVIENLITEKNIDTFLFGSKSEFDSLCYNVVSKLKNTYPHIKRVYVRSAFQYIDDSYKDYLLGKYEDTYYPKHIENSGKASYVERNQEMINKSNFCIIYYDKNYLPAKRKNKEKMLIDYQPKSGTEIAYKYALKKKKVIYNMFK